eukprot:Nk52_evm7s89 gene=Nk52_evmTU7s89
MAFHRSLVVLGILMSTIVVVSALSVEDLQKRTDEVNKVIDSHEEALFQANLEEDKAAVRQKRGGLIGSLFKRPCNGICYDHTSNYCKASECSKCPPRSREINHWACLCDSNARMPSFVNKTDPAQCEAWDNECCGTGKYCPSCENCPVGFYFADKYDLSDEDIENERVYGSIEGTFGKCINNQGCMRSTKERCNPKISCPLGSAYDHGEGKCICGGINKDDPEMAAYVNFINWRKSRPLYPINLGDSCLGFPPAYFKNYWEETNTPKKEMDYRVIPRMWTCSCPPGTAAFNGNGNGFRFCIKKTLAETRGDPHVDNRCVEDPKMQVDFYHSSDVVDYGVGDQEVDKWPYEGIESPDPGSNQEGPDDDDDEEGTDDDDDDDEEDNENTDPDDDTDAGDDNNDEEDSGDDEADEDDTPECVDCEESEDNDTDDQGGDEKDDDEKPKPPKPDDGDDDDDDKEEEEEEEDDLPNCLTLGAELDVHRLKLIGVLLQYEFTADNYYRRCASRCESRGKTSSRGRRGC